MYLNVWGPFLIRKHFFVFPETHKNLVGLYYTDSEDSYDTVETLLRWSDTVKIRLIFSWKYLHPFLDECRISCNRRKIRLLGTHRKVKEIVRYRIENSIILVSDSYGQENVLHKLETKYSVIGLHSFLFNCKYQEWYVQFIYSCKLERLRNIKGTPSINIGKNEKTLPSLLVFPIPLEPWH